MKIRNPVETMANTRHEFGEHGGVNMSVEASTTFTVLKSGTMPEIFHGEKGPDQGGCYLYGRHFNPTVYNLGKQLAAARSTHHSIINNYMINIKIFKSTTIITEV